MSAEEDSSVPPGYTRLSLVLVDDVVDAIRGIQAYQGLGTPDEVVQRAVSWYNHTIETQLKGGQLFVQEQDGKFYGYAGGDGIFPEEFGKTVPSPRKWWHRFLG